MNNETEIFNIISHGGDAKAIAYEALQLAHEYKFNLSRNKMEEAQTALTKAHNTQTKLIQTELNGEEVKISLLMVHAQDHLMTSISEIALIEQMIKMLEKIERLENK